MRYVHRTNSDESALLMPITGIPNAVTDRREPYEKTLAVYFILVTTALERVAYYSLVATLVIGADPGDCASVKGPLAALVFTGTSNVSAFVFAIFGDWKLGRFKSILLGFSLYLIGFTIAIAATSGTEAACFGKITTDNTRCIAWIIPALVIIAIGAGAVQVNTAVFGAEQIQENQFTSRFFDKYVIAVNIGAIISRGTFYSFDDIDKPYSLPYIYGMVALFLAACLFPIGYRYYIHVRTSGTILTQCIPVTINAFRTWKLFYKDKSRTTERQSLPTDPSVIIEEDDSTKMNLQISTYLDYAKARNGGKYLERIVDDVKSLRSASLAFILLIPYWLIYDQLNSTFRLQGKRMKDTSNTSLLLVSLADPLILILILLVLNLFVYKYLAEQKKLLTIATKFVVGMCFGVITMVMTGTLEIFRQNQWPSNQNQSDLTIYYQIPPGIGMGVSELFVMVASYEFAYFAAPRSAQTLFMSLRFLTIGLSSFIGSGYIAAFKSDEYSLDFACRAPSSDFKWRYYAYFFILAGVQLLFIVIFILCQRKFEIIKHNRQHTRKTNAQNPASS